MSRTPYMQFYVGDYIQKTLHLTTEQNGAYLLLLFAMWQGDACLPNDASKLARIARVSPKRWGAIWSEIERFFTVDDGVIRQDRLTREFQKVLSISAERKTSGSLGGKAKALKDNVVRLATANGLLWQSDSESESDKKEEKREAKASHKNRGSRLPADWSLPSDWREWAISRGLSAGMTEIEGERFANYWVAAAGAKGVKMDWKRTWQNWVLDKIQRERPRPHEAAPVQHKIRARLPGEAQ